MEIQFLKLSIPKRIRDHLLNNPYAIYKIPKFEFDEILEKKTYKNGEIHFYQQQDRVVFLCQGYKFSQFVRDIAVYSTYWYLLEYRAENEDIDHSVNGMQAWQTFTKVLYKRYTGEEIENIRSSYRYLDKPSIEHYSWFNLNNKPNEIIEFDNAYYFDLNKAYAFYLEQMFPKLDKWLKIGYQKNKERFKKIVNYSVGMMTHYDEWYDVRSWIVNQVSEKVVNAIVELSGEDVYVNTDGLIVNNPKRLIAHSQELGDFKLVPVDNNKVWIYHQIGQGGTSYSVLQYFENGEKVIKSLGGFRREKCLIDKLDLSTGVVPVFNFRDNKGIQVVDEGGISWLDLNRN